MAQHDCRYEAKLNVDAIDASSAGRSTQIHPGFVEIFQELIDAMPEQIALVDEYWTILAFNPAWTKTASRYGCEALQLGSDYAAFCRERANEGHNAASPAVEGIAEIDAGRRDSFDYFYEGNDRWEGHTFHLSVNRLSIDGHTLAIITRYEISELMQLRRQREDFSQSLMETQAEERRRIARELHDSTQQLLVSISLTLGQLKRAHKPGEAGEAIKQIEGLLADVQQEIRSIAYVSHPPVLNHIGLRGALRELVSGYGRRACLRTSCEIQGDGMSFWPAAEMAIYRIVQEALSNVHRHAHATRVDVYLIFRKSMVHAVIADDGIGMAGVVSYGVGISGMRSRLTELGGRLFVRREPSGTTIIASVPRKSHIRPIGDLAV